MIHDFRKIFLTCRCCSLLLKNTDKLVEFHYTELTFSQNKDELNQTKVQHFYHHISLFTSILIANYIPRKKQKRLFFFRTPRKSRKVQQRGQVVNWKGIMSAPCVLREVPQVRSWWLQRRKRVWDAPWQF